MKLEQERIFLEVATALSFSKAAQNLDISTSAVSKQIKNIEDQLGQALMVRSSRSLRLTYAGIAYLETCKQIEAARSGFKEQLSEMGGEVKGQIRITCPPVYASHVLIPQLREFSDLYPQVNFFVNTNYQNVDIISNSFDLAIRLGNLEDSSLIAKKLNDVQLYIVCSKEYSKNLGIVSSISDLNSAKFILVEGFELKQSIISRYFNELTLDSENVFLSTNDTRVHLESVIQGMGISVLPDYLIQKELKSGLLVNIFPKMALSALPLNVLYPGQRNMPIRIRKFIDFLYEKNKKKDISKITDVEA